MTREPSSGRSARYGSFPLPGDRNRAGSSNPRMINPHKTSAHEARARPSIYSEITICDVLVTGIFILFQNGTLSWKLYVTTTFTAFPTALQGSGGALLSKFVVGFGQAFAAGQVETPFPS